MGYGWFIVGIANVVHYEECYDMSDLSCVICKLLSCMFGNWVVTLCGENICVCALLC